MTAIRRFVLGVWDFVVGDGPLTALGVVVVSFLVSLKAMDWLSPSGAVKAPVIAEPPPLPPPDPNKKPKLSERLEIPPRTRLNSSCERSS